VEKSLEYHLLHSRTLDRALKKIRPLIKPMTLVFLPLYVLARWDNGISSAEGIILILGMLLLYALERHLLRASAWVVGPALMLLAAGLLIAGALLLGKKGKKGTDLIAEREKNQQLNQSPFSPFFYFSFSGRQ
jgi:hypothetical protein